MQPKQLSYPEFVADQVLTKDNLNDLFSYLDEQDRITRTNLIGVGIVCGLEVSTNAAGTQVTISGGCGVTSGGYLITFPTTTFTQYKDYNAVKPMYYEKFVDVPAKKQLCKLDELFESAVTEGTVPLNKNYLKDKVVMLYVEKLENNNKNCDPQSCDDKGMNVEITFRPLLISIGDAAKLKTAGADYGEVNYKKLPILKMQRFNVPASLLQSTAKVLQEYQKILSVNFLKNVQKALSGTYNMLLPLVKDIYPTDPFSTLVEDFAFLNDNSITEKEALNFQYYYDLFSDIELAYSELRETGVEALSLCCPDENLFRLHLLLGDAIPVGNNAKLENRQYFIPSPVMECHCKQTQTLRWLFKRIQLLLQNFYPEYGIAGNFGEKFGRKRLEKKLNDTVIRITPSLLGKYSLGDKAIPFYYLPDEGTNTLVDNWNIQKTMDGEADQNLSYNANLYASDDYVLNPCSYDLEPYNFLRIEGHVGMKYSTALKSIINLRDRNRLPFDVVTVGSDLESLKIALSSLGKNGTVEALLETYAEQIKAPCQFNDLDALWDAFLAEIICQLCKTMLYFYGLVETPREGAKAAPSKVPLVLDCNPKYVVQPATFGYYFEDSYQSLSGNDVNALRETYRRMSEMRGNEGVNDSFFFLMDLEAFYESLKPSLATFDYNASLVAYRALLTSADRLITSINSNTEQDSVMRATLEQLKKLVAMCFLKPVAAIYKDYLLRWVSVMMLQKFGHFARKHPGIQHKAGVPMGGTFIMVYHEKKVSATIPPPAPVPPPPAVKAKDIIAEGLAGVKEAIKNSGEQITGAIAKEMIERGSAPVQDKNVKFEEMQKVEIPVTEINQQYVYHTPAYEKAGMSVVNDLEIFKSENEKEFDDLAILLADIMDDDSSNLQDAISDIANGVVFADFYLPYMCCSDCPPIQYTVTEVLENITISVKPDVFCNADTDSYVIMVTPDGGDINGEGASKDTSGKFVFKPSDVKIAGTDAKKDVTITYNAFGQSASTKVTVYQKPTAKFDAKVVKDTDTVTITNSSSVFADRYLWTFGDGQTSTVKDPGTITYTADGTYEINLTVYNNICSDTTKTTVTVTTPDVSIGMSKTDFCSQDDSTYQVTVAPDGTTVGGEGVVLNGTTYFFAPGKVDLQGAGKKPVVLTASKGGKTKTLNVTVYQMPAADFEADVNEDGDTVTIRNESSQFIEKYLWDFGDGQTSTDKDPAPHAYAKEGNPNVRLTVTNGPCTDKAEKEIAISFVSVNIAMKNTEFCSDNNTPQEIIYSPDDAKISGDGLSVVDGKYVFTPKSISMGGKDKVTVTLIASTTHESESFEVTVYQTPDASFTRTPNSDNPAVMEFVNTSSTLTGQYDWDFGDGTPHSTGLTPLPHTFAPGDHTVTLTVTNGVCTSKPFKDSFHIAVPQTIDIDPKVFCNSDPKPYKILVSGDDINVGGVSISSPAAGEYVFTPSGVTMLPAQPRIDTVLTNGAKSVPITIYNKPVPSFFTSVTGAPPFTLIFNNTTPFGDTFSWDFGDKTAPDNGHSPAHTFPGPGTYMVTLTVTNGGVCTTVGEPQPVAFQGGQPINPKECSPLAPIRERFSGLKGVDTKNFPAFAKQYNSYNQQIVPFFTAIQNAGGLSIDDQIALFLAQNAGTLLAKWITELTAMLKQPELVRPFAKLIAALVSILAELAEYIACIQSEDVSKAKVPMQTALTEVGAFVDAFLAMENDPQQKPLVDPAMQQLTQIDTDAKAELTRVAGNGESTIKKGYVNLLNKIVKLFG